MSALIVPAGSDYDYGDDAYEAAPIAIAIDDSLNVTDILNALDPEIVLKALALWPDDPARIQPTAIRLEVCPQCRLGSKKQGISVNPNTGHWKHWGSECKGDLLTMIALHFGLDTKTGFRDVLAKANEISGGLTVDDLERRMREKAARARELAALSASASRDARSKWEHMPSSHKGGAKFLESRGLDAEVLEMLGVIKYGDFGDPSIALYETDGTVVSIVRRNRTWKPGADFGKCKAFPHAPTQGTFIDHVSSIRYKDDVVIVEGFIDACTARLAWPDWIVLGANGGDNMGNVAARCVAKIHSSKARLWVVPHKDTAGEKALEKVKDMAIAAHVELRVIRLEVKDLNEAWCARDEESSQPMRYSVEVIKP